MNLVISEYNKKYEINVGNVTQVLGVNHRIKKFIFDSLVKHFSLYKYQDYDEYMEENVRINGEIPGRKEYRVISIKDRETLIEQIKLSKNTLIYEYFKNILETLSCQKQLNMLDDNLTQIYILINEKLSQNIGDICIDYEMQNLLSIVSKSEIISKSGAEIESVSNFELLNILLKLIKENSKFNPEKIMILLYNIDHLLTNIEYEKIINILFEFDKIIYTFFYISTDNYVYLDKETLRNVAVFNNTSFQVPDFHILEEFIENHYPLNYDFSEEEILLMLKKVLNKVGTDGDVISYKELLVKKMINKAICVNDIYDFELSESELACLNSK